MVLNGTEQLAESTNIIDMYFLSSASYSPIHGDWWIDEQLKCHECKLQIGSFSLPTSISFIRRLRSICNWQKIHVSTIRRIRLQR